MLLGIGKAVVLLGAFGLAYALFALLGLQLALESREVAAPDLANLTPEEASATVAAAGLALRVEAARRVDQSIAPGRVADQEPGPGVVTRRGRSVKIWLSSGLIPGAAPTLIGASEPAARQRLAEASFALQGVAEIRSGGIRRMRWWPRNRLPADAGRQSGCSSTAASAKAPTSCPT